MARPESERPPLPTGCTSVHERLAGLFALTIIVGIWLANAMKDNRITFNEWLALGICVGMVVLLYVTDAHRCIRATAPRNRR